MAATRDLAAEQGLVDTLSGIVQSYEEIAVMRMQQVRGGILHNRAFITSLADVYADLRQAGRVQDKHFSWRQRHLTDEEQKEAAGQTAVARQAALLLTPDRRLSGSIVSDVFTDFARFVDEHPNYQLIVVGRVGQELAAARWPQRSRQDIPLSTSDNLNLQSLRPVLQSLRPYEEVVVFYGSFENLLRQTVVHNDLRGDQPLLSDEQSRPADRELARYVFEPDLETLADFFANQFFALLFQETLQEAYLAELGSRITAMEQATSAINQRRRQLISRGRQQRRRQQARKQLSGLAGLSLWYT